MLILTRKKGERIVVNGNIVIVVLETTSGKTKLGIEAPENVTIFREEVLFRDEPGRPDDWTPTK